MARRRMFSLDIIDTDYFLDLPQSSQSFYFHLALRADDDGFVASPKKIQKMVNASDDDMKLLIAKGFIIPFKTGICVITHWKIHNLIQKDRYKETIYTDEKNLLEQEENGTYKCLQDVSNMETQVSIGKDSKDKISKDKIIKHKYGQYKHVLLSDDEYNELKKELPDYEYWIKKVDEGIEMKPDKYKYKNFYLAIKNWKSNESKFATHEDKEEKKLRERQEMVKEIIRKAQENQDNEK